jgi:hypothetical protein
MNITKIEIENIKGIVSQKFDLNIRPNSPAILVAPNGFGKSSISIGFKSLNRNRINLHEDHHYKKDITYQPIIRLCTDDPSKAILEATNTKNELSQHFDVVVINSLVRPKSINRVFGGGSKPSADMVVDTITLVDTIPENKKFQYQISEEKARFGEVGKALPNLKTMPAIDAILAKMHGSDIFGSIVKTKQTKVLQAIQSFIDKMNAWIGSQSADQVLSQIENIEAPALQSLTHLSDVTTFISSFNLDSSSNKNAFNCLVALQFCLKFQDDIATLKAVCKRKKYEEEKSRLTQLFKDFDTTTANFTPIEREGSLILKFPDISTISSGQRDVMSFIAMLEVARGNIGRKDLILIIDEVFDYLDESNLVAAQYYISRFIDENKGLNIYPILMTHLDPDLFLGHVFGKKLKTQQVFLKKYPQQVSESMKKLLKERNDQNSPIKSLIEKKLIHYHSEPINNRSSFELRQLKPTWGNQGVFYNFINAEKSKFLLDDPSYDPAAVCCAVRVGIEKAIHDLLQSDEQKSIFLDQMDSGTLCKLEYADQCGIQVPEVFYLLSLVYNEGLHWKDYSAFVPRMVSKLENRTINNMIKSVPNI